VRRRAPSWGDQHQRAALATMSLEQIVEDADTAYETLTGSVTYPELCQIPPQNILNLFDPKHCCACSVVVSGKTHKIFAENPALCPKLPRCVKPMMVSNEVLPVPDTDISPSRSQESAALLPLDLRIEELHSIAALKAVEDLQVRVWGFKPRGVAPANVLYVSATYGGLVLGAYVGDTLVGFVFGLLGRRKGRLCHVSHMLGVHPEFQGQGIGAALKQHQREWVREQGIDAMIWTFDPLEARNAYLNLHKLGAITHTYYVDLYGDLGGRVHRGLPTDRLLAEWDVRADAGPAIEIRHEGRFILRDVDKRPCPVFERIRDDVAFLVAVPSQIQQIKGRHPESALAWRLAVREALTWAFARGYVAVDFIDGAYVLVQDGATIAGNGRRRV
jgi:predicted GNAT superfamily acetyltransferase